MQQQPRESTSASSFFNTRNPVSKALKTMGLQKKSSKEDVEEPAVAAPTPVATESTSKPLNRGRQISFDRIKRSLSMNRRAPVRTIQANGSGDQAGDPAGVGKESRGVPRRRSKEASPRSGSPLRRGTSLLSWKRTDNGAAEELEAKAKPTAVRSDRGRRSRTSLDDAARHHYAGDDNAEDEDAMRVVRSAIAIALVATSADEVCEVTVPKGARAGDELEAVTASGFTVRIIVPEGVGAGEILTFALDGGSRTAEGEREDLSKAPKLAADAAAADAAAAGAADVLRQLSETTAAVAAALQELSENDPELDADSALAARTSPSEAAAPVPAAPCNTPQPVSAAPSNTSHAIRKEAKVSRELPGRGRPPSAARRARAPCRARARQCRRRTSCATSRDLPQSPATSRAGEGRRARRVPVEGDGTDGGGLRVRSDRIRSDRIGSGL